MAAACYRQWTEQAPDDPEAWHMLAAVTGEAVPERAGDDYIQRLFDRFADSFDEQLQRLDYQAPQLLAALIAGQWPTPDSTLQILDAGCGTGLCRGSRRTLGDLIGGPRTLQRRFDQAAGCGGRCRRRRLFCRGLRSSGAAATMW